MIFLESQATFGEDLMRIPWNPVLMWEGRQMETFPEHFNLTIASQRENAAIPRKHAITRCHNHNER